MIEVPLTVTIATNDGWETVRSTYEAVRGQAEAHGADIILVDGSDTRQPTPDDLGPTTRWIHMPGADISEMRARAYREARGRIVSMTEDHVAVAPDWVAGILRAHAEHPEAAAIGGAVRNSAPHNRIDWASFYAGHAPFLEPLPAGPAEYLSGINVSYKREALLAALNQLGDRAIETLINERIKADGGVLVTDPRLVVNHFQSRGVRGTALLHYYAGRHFEGTRRSTHRDAPLRVVRAAVMPVPRGAKRLVTALRHGQPVGRVVSVAPAMMLIATTQAVGELVGILRGPGRSATKLH